jgi:hypothetical protein
MFVPDTIVYVDARRASVPETKSDEPQQIAARMPDAAEMGCMKGVRFLWLRRLGGWEMHLHRQG